MKIKEIEDLLNTVESVQLNCADGGVFSISVGGKCITITPECSSLGSDTWLDYEIVSDET